jgi:hypothetical protein
MSVGGRIPRRRTQRKYEPCDVLHPSSVRIRVSGGSMRRVGRCSLRYGRCARHQCSPSISKGLRGMRLASVGVSRDRSDRLSKQFIPYSRVRSPSGGVFEVARMLRRTRSTGVSARRVLSDFQSGVLGSRRCNAGVRGLPVVVEQGVLRSRRWVGRWDGRLSRWSGAPRPARLQSAECEARHDVVFVRGWAGHGLVCRGHTGARKSSTGWRGDRMSASVRGRATFCATSEARLLDCCRRW